MPFSVATAVLDDALNNIKNNSTGLVFVENQTLPTDLAQETARITVGAADWTGPAAGDGGGNARKITYNGESNYQVDSHTSENNAYHAVVVGVADAILLVTEIASSPVQIPTPPGTVTVSTFDYEIEDAVEKV